MEEDLPYQVEYAKSGRASCKICKIQISQGSLRLARMIQSPHFDGKVPTWHHDYCFFKKYMPKSCAEIGKFDAIRWDDQEKIREKIGDDAVDGSAKGGNQKENQCITNTDFSIEYSKSGRAKCRSCEEKIEKDVVRVAKMELPDEPKKGVGLVPRWHHLDCFVAARDDLGAEELTPEQIPGFAALKDDDREDISRKFGVPKKKNVIKSKSTEVPDQKPDMEKLREKEVLKKQSKRFWQVRDHLQTQFELKTVRSLLELNGEDSTGGEAQILDRCTDGILFGSLEPCPECNQKRIRYSAEKGYVCHGDLTEWTNCTYRTFTPKRTVWKVTKEYKEGTFLENIKLKVAERKFPSEVITKANADSAFGNQGSLTSEVPGKPLNEKKIVLIGKLKESRATINTKVESLGGIITDAVNRQCFCCISSPGEVLKSSAKMTKAESCNIPVVAEEYLDAITKGGAKTMLSQFAIAPWGSGGESATETTKSGGVKRKNSAAEEEGSSSSSKKAKVTLKGGAVVDPAFEKAESCHLLTINGEIYTAVLGLVNLLRGSNTYYKLQLLQHDTKKSRYYVFRSWGRVGTTIGSTKTEQFNSREDAVESFLDVYYEKTGNMWRNRKNFVKKPNLFYPLDIDYGQDDEVVKSAIEPGSRSKLAEPLKELIKFIFDIEAMKDALVEFEIDLKKMPLGKLSRKQIETAYSCLTESLKYVEGGVTGGKVLDVSNRFYTLIPHDFGLDTPPLLNHKELIDLKIKMLDSLLEIEVAYNICKQAKEDEDPVDVHYQSLNTAMNVVSKDSEEFKMICTYVSNTHAKTHSNYSLEVEEVFDVSRKGERQRYRPFKDLHNRKLLWHGSRSTNFVGILSQGLRIAPPEAPVTGYMFGKGVYFADMASKSANYCNTNRNNNTGLMLLCEVALGNEYQLTASEHIVKLPPGKHSCKGMGRTGPDPNLEKKLPDGVVVPLGTGVEDNELDSSLLYNEYIIYDTAQCNMKYLVKLKFNYKY